MNYFNKYKFYKNKYLKSKYLLKGGVDNLRDLLRDTVAGTDNIVGGQPGTGQWAADYFYTSRRICYKDNKKFSSNHGKCASKQGQHWHFFSGGGLHVKDTDGASHTAKTIKGALNLFRTILIEQYFDGTDNAKENYPPPYASQQDTDGTYNVNSATTEVRRDDKLYKWHDYDINMSIKNCYNVLAAHEGEDEWEPYWTKNIQGKTDAQVHTLLDVNNKENKEYIERLKKHHSEHPLPRQRWLLPERSSGLDNIRDFHQTVHKSIYDDNRMVPLDHEKVHKARDSFRNQIYNADAKYTGEAVKRVWNQHVKYDLHTKPKVKNRGCKELIDCNPAHFGVNNLTDSQKREYYRNPSDNNIFHNRDHNETTEKIGPSDYCKWRGCGTCRKVKNEINVHGKLDRTTNGQTMGNLEYICSDTEAENRTLEIEPEVKNFAIDPDRQPVVHPMRRSTVGFVIPEVGQARWSVRRSRMRNQEPPEFMLHTEGPRYDDEGRVL